MVLNSDELADILLSQVGRYLFIDGPTLVKLLKRVAYIGEPLFLSESGDSKLVYHFIIALDKFFPKKEYFRGEVILLAIDIDEGESFLGGIINLGYIA